jgi:hypothetical protein
MNAVPEMVPYITTRIDRAYKHMLNAKSTNWAHAWGDVFCLYVRARNAQRTPAEVRELERQRGLR